MTSYRNQNTLKATFFSTLVCCAMFMGGTFAQTAPPQPIDPAAQASPRATVRTFYDTMTAVRNGAAERLPEAIDCLFLGEDIPPADRMSKGLEAAEELFSVLESIQFSIEDIPETYDQRTYEAEFGHGEKKVTLRLRRYDDGKWRFHSSTVAEAETLSEQVVEDVTEPESGLAALNELMKSPRASMQTFIQGMNETNNLTQEEAIATLDLSKVPKSVRFEVGLNYATQLIEIIDRYKLVEYTEIPPESEREQYIFLADKEGNIVLDVVVDEETNERAWKFTKGTLETIEPLYQKYRERPLVAGLKEKKRELPWAVRIQNWMADHTPFLLGKTLYLSNFQWLGLFTVVLTGMLISRIFSLFLVAFIRRRFNKAHFRLDEKLERDFVRPIRIALMAWFWLLGLSILGLPADALTVLKIAAQIVTAIGAVWALYKLVDIIGNYLLKRAEGTENKFDDLLVPLLTRSLKVFVIVAAIVQVAERNEWDLSTLLAGLGLGGLAFALAAKDVVANIFGSFTILLDRPFEIGDWVTIGDIDGNVETVGIRSTRIRTFYNSLITVPNSELINTSVDNLGKRRYRRIKTNISITYDTSPEKIEAFCEGIRELIRQHPYTRKDYYHCYFNQFAAHSLDILLYCFVETPDWSTELREKHRLFLDITRLAKRIGIEFAFPTQTLYMREDMPMEVLGPKTPDEALNLGRKEASNIVKEFLGGPGVVPPPVTIDMPGSSVDDTQIGEEGDGGK